MRKYLLIVLLFAAALSLSAKQVFNCSMNGTGKALKGTLKATAKTEKVVVEIYETADGNDSIYIRNLTTVFKFSTKSYDVYVGNVTIKPIKITKKADGSMTFVSTSGSDEQNVSVYDGDDPTIDWDGDDFDMPLHVDVTGSVDADGKFDMEITGKPKIDTGTLYGEITIDAVLNFKGEEDKNAGVGSVSAEQPSPVAEYDVTGRKWTNGNGITIVRLSDGKTVKRISK